MRERNIGGPLAPVRDDVTDQVTQPIHLTGHKQFQLRMTNAYGSYHDTILLSMKTTFFGAAQEVPINGGTSDISES